MVERVFGPDDRQTPAIAINDGVDCVPMKPWKAFLVQLLNIAGTGPIFGALMGACFGPVVFLWIVFGSILGGAVHDYMSGMISCRHGGDSIAELSGVYLGGAARWIMRVFSIVMLTLTLVAEYSVFFDVIQPVITVSSPMRTEAASPTLMLAVRSQF